MNWKTPSIFAVAIILSACSAPSMEPNELVALGNVRNTATVQAQAAQATAAPFTQDAANAQFNRSLTETFVPPALTATANSNVATEQAGILAAQRATSEAFYVAGSVTATQQALEILESDTQERIAQNNRAIAESQYRANAMQWVWYGGMALFLFGMFAFVVIALYHGQQAMMTARQVYERRAWDKVEIETEVKAREFGLIVTSSGFTTSRALSAPIVEQKVSRYSHEQAWRTAIRKLVEHGIIAGQGGAKHPFSETTLGQYVIRPDNGSMWLDGYRKLSRVLQANGIWVVAGPRIAPVWGDGWNWDRFSREFDLTPLHHIPEGNPPDVKTPAWSFAEAP